MKTKTDKRVTWTPKQEDYLVMEYHRKDIASLALSLNRTPSAIRFKAHELGLTRRIKSKESAKDRWSTDQEGLLRQYYHTYSMDELSKLLRKAPGEIRIKAFDMCLSWRSGDRNQQPNRERMTITDLEEQLAQCEDLLIGLCTPGSITMWSSIVRKYNALWIQWHHMKGERLIVSSGIKTDYII